MRLYCCVDVESISVPHSEVVLAKQRACYTHALMIEGTPFTFGPTAVVNLWYQANLNKDSKFDDQG